MRLALRADVPFHHVPNGWTIVAWSHCHENYFVLLKLWSRVARVAVQFSTNIQIQPYSVPFHVNISGLLLLNNNNEQVLQLNYTSIPHIVYADVVLFCADSHTTWTAEVYSHSNGDAAQAWNLRLGKPNECIHGAHRTATLSHARNWNRTHSARYPHTHLNESNTLLYVVIVCK